MKMCVSLLLVVLVLVPLAVLAQPADPIVAPTDIEGIAAPDRPTVTVEQLPPDVALTPTETTTIEDAVAVEVADVAVPVAVAVNRDAFAMTMLILGGMMVTIWSSAGKLGDMFKLDSRIIALALGVVGSLVLFLLGMLPMLPSDWKGAAACVFFGMLAATNGGMSSQTGRTPTGNAGNLEGP